MACKEAKLAAHYLRSACFASQAAVAVTAIKKHCLSPPGCPSYKRPCARMRSTRGPSMQSLLCRRQPD